ncbi:MAG: hypothetical protein A2289_10360 [Deltaproteobacteria bacterium RIFOXYA12_FULL_58_15]|nr:MAG: hypothetical protein A2289_10360 [Deltaproteobacteria bacterium RIFOXYA12_FULL_58_15]
MSPFYTPAVPRQGLRCGLWSIVNLPGSKHSKPLGCRSMTKFITSIFLLLLGACATSFSQTSPCPASSSTSKSENVVLGVVNGIEIRRSDIGADLEAELKEIKNESLQREMHMLWVATDEAITETLMQKEAEQRGISKDELRQQEVNAKLSMPTDEQVQAIYDENKDVIGVPIETAAPHIKRQLVEEQAAEVERSLVSQFRKGAEISYSLPIPILPRFDVGVGRASIWGKETAKVTIVEFSDFECPYCGRASETIEDLRELYPETVRLAFRDFPLSQHAHARPAAEAAHCADEQGKFWEYHDILFANSRALSAEDLIGYAEKLELDKKAFADCLASERPKALVEENMAAARELKLSGTPSIFINGIKLIGLLPLPLLQAIIDDEIGSP